MLSRLVEVRAEIERSLEEAARSKPLRDDEELVALGTTTVSLALNDESGLPEDDLGELEPLDGVTALVSPTVEGGLLLSAEDEGEVVKALE